MRPLSRSGFAQVVVMKTDLINLIRERDNAKDSDPAKAAAIEEQLREVRAKTPHRRAETRSFETR